MKSQFLRQNYSGSGDRAKTDTPDKSARFRGRKPIIPTDTPDSELPLGIGIGKHRDLFYIIIKKPQNPSAR